MKCTKIKLGSRKDHQLKGTFGNKCLKSDQNAFWITTGYQGYSYKLARIRKPVTPTEQIEPNLTISTIIFPENISFNTGASTEKWRKKTPRLISAKTKNHTSRKNILDDEYDFSCDLSDILEDQKQGNNLEVGNGNQNENLCLNFDDYEVSSEIEELLLKSQRTRDGKNEKIKENKRRNKNSDQDGEDKVKNKRSNLKKTIRFSFSKPASPVTEQVIRVDVTSTFSAEELMNNNFLKHVCSKGHGKIVNEDVVKMATETYDNREKNVRLKDAMEEDFIIKCKQLALTPKER